MENYALRVIYEWRVTEKDFPEFRQTWSYTTNHIHNTVPGALGSFLVRSTSDPEKVLTIARWQSRSCWEAFFKDQNPEQMSAMRRIAERVSVEAFDEIEDATKTH